jgi:hypothetical protein
VGKLATVMMRLMSVCPRYWDFLLQSGMKTLLLLLFCLLLLLSSLSLLLLSLLSLKEDREEDRIKGILALLMVSMAWSSPTAVGVGAMNSVREQKNSQLNFFLSLLSLTMVLVFLMREANAWALKEDMINWQRREGREGEGGERKRERKNGSSHVVFLVENDTPRLSV